MRLRTFTIAMVLAAALTAAAEDWYTVTKSNDYYYGKATGATEKEAMDAALAQLSGMIVTHVASNFESMADETNTNGTIDHQTRVKNYIRSYSQATLRNVTKWTEENGSEVTAYCYMLRSEMEKVYRERTDRACAMVKMAAEYEQKNKVDMALQYYYWAYALVRSLQNPSAARDKEGRLLLDYIYNKVVEVVSNVSVTYENREENNVNLLFRYKNSPVASLAFSYSDGRSDCMGEAKDGRGMMEMVDGYAPKQYHLAIDYEMKERAVGDAEMETVLQCTPRRAVAKAQIVVAVPQTQQQKTAAQKDISRQTEVSGITLKPSDSQTVASNEGQARSVERIVEAVRTRQYSSVMDCFTADGNECYDRLIRYGRASVVGTPRLQYFKGPDSITVVRGLQMSFSFKTGKKRTFVEDVVFTINREGKVASIAFGLGQTAENDILCKNPAWGDETREMIMEFLENYKTAYCLKRLEYIRGIFDDNATIIVGNVAKKATHQAGDRGMTMTDEGRDIINYNRYSKDEYLANLERCFRRNEFINIQLTNNEIQWLDKFSDEKLFAIQIGQQYHSSTYSDKGFLFLLVDMKSREEPRIMVRTWQPNEVEMSKLYNAGDFYRAK